MQYRISLFLMIAVAVGVSARFGGYAEAFTETFKSLPGGMEGVPRYTLMMLALSGFFATWWWLVLAVVAGALFGGAHWLERTEEGRAQLARLARGADKYRFLLNTAFIVVLWEIWSAHALATQLPLLRMIQALGGD